MLDDLDDDLGDLFARKTNDALAALPAESREAWVAACAADTAAIFAGCHVRRVLAAVRFNEQARAKGWPTGHVVGSHAASATAWLLGLRNVDPVAIGLLDEAPLWRESPRPLTIDVGRAGAEMDRASAGQVEVWCTPLVTVVHEAMRDAGIERVSMDDPEALDVLSRARPAAELGCALDPPAGGAWHPRDVLEVALAMHLTNRPAIPHPVPAAVSAPIEDIVSPTAGRIVWGVQQTNIARRIAGLSAEDAHDLRRDLGKLSRVDSWRKVFVSGAAARGFSVQTSAAIFDELTAARLIGSRAGWVVFASVVLRWAFLHSRAPAALERAERRARNAPAPRAR
jgi:hypothetical protein